MTEAEELWHPLSAEELEELEGAGLAVPQAEAPTGDLHSEEQTATAEVHYPGVRTSAAREFAEGDVDPDPANVGGGE